MAKQNTKLKIKQLALHYFLEKGYAQVSVGDLSKLMGISKGTFVFHYPTKENLLVELIKDLCEFQWQVLEQEIKVENDPLVAYLYELATMAGSCYDNPPIRQLYVSAYVHPASLKVIRENDTVKAKKVFGTYCKEWTEQDFIIAEDIVSGIEYSMFATEHEKEIPLDDRLSGIFDVILKSYRVPEDIRKETIQKVLSMEYRELGKRILNEFREYVEETHQKELEEAVAKKQVKQKNRRE
ncbi:MAG: TetR/AcrR family transcriptional regulator [Lachnospiraceae bacterium]|nr:TetR/AcrR family transcriptional regulator [Lachnospiraceae bacterium]